MAGVLIGQNVTLRISGEVSGTASASNSVVTAYTAPNSGYAIVQVRVINASGSGVDILIDGRSMTGLLTAPPASGVFYQFYIGPSQTLQAASGPGGSGTFQVTGVEFINSP